MCIFVLWITILSFIFLCIFIEATLINSIDPAHTQKRRKKFYELQCLFRFLIFLIDFFFFIFFFIEATCIRYNGHPPQ